MVCACVLLLQDLILIILVVAAIISMTVGGIEHPDHGWMDGLAILVSRMQPCTAQMHSQLCAFYTLLIQHVLCQHTRHRPTDVSGCGCGSGRILALHFLMQHPWSMCYD